MTEQLKAGWRTRVGIALFTLSIVWPVLIPVLPLLGVSATATAAFSGVMLVAAELLLLAGAAIAGKDGFALITASASAFLKSHGPPREVGRRRYKVGLVMLAIPLAFGWASPYFVKHIPGFESSPWTYAIAGDVLVLISLFVLGGGFWDKLRALFLHRAVVAIPEIP